MSEKRVAAVVLAAGHSSRMGTTKQLLEIEGQPLLRRTVKTVLAAVPHAFVVFGFKAHEVRGSLRDLPFSSLLAHQWENGLSESVKEAVASIWTWNNLYESSERPEGFLPYNAILFVPCDLPLLSTEHLSALINAYQTANAPLVVSQWDDVLGIPALFDRVLWPEFESLSGDEGARKIIRLHEEVALQVAFPDGKYDLDTPQQLENFTSQHR